MIRGETEACTCGSGAAGVDGCQTGQLGHRGFCAESYCHFVSLGGPNDHFVNVRTLKGHNYTQFFRCVVCKWTKNNFKGGQVKDERANIDKLSEGCTHAQTY